MACTFLILPASDTECFQIFLDILAKNFSRKHILLVLNVAGYHNSGELVIPANVTLAFCPPYSPEPNPQEHIWDPRENLQELRRQVDGRGR
jgi:hypothetical protein